MLQVWFQQGTLKVAHLGPLQRFDHSASYNLDSENDADEKTENSDDVESNGSSGVTKSEDRESDADDLNEFNEYLTEDDDYIAAFFNNDASEDREPNENYNDSEDDNSVANSENVFEAQNITVDILLHLQEFLSQGNIHIIIFKLFITYFKGKLESGGGRSRPRELSKKIKLDFE